MSKRCEKCDEFPGSGKCASCFGSGKDIHINSTRTECVACSGTGVCPACHGEGPKGAAVDSLWRGVTDSVQRWFSKPTERT
jgi:hypothetical protein